MSLRTDELSSDTASVTAPAAAAADVVSAPVLERKGRAWLLWSFLLCPCHLPLSLAALTAVLAGTSFGVVLRDHAWVAGTLITGAWVLGTGYGLRLIRQAEKAGGACAVGSTGLRRRLSRAPETP